MKKAYEAPAAEVFELQTEGSILTGSGGSNSLKLNNQTVVGNQALSNKKSVWSSSNWANSDN